MLLYLLLSRHFVVLRLCAALHLHWWFPLNVAVVVASVAWALELACKNSAAELPALCQRCGICGYISSRWRKLSEDSYRLVNGVRRWAGGSDGGRPSRPRSTHLPRPVLPYSLACAYAGRACVPSTFHMLVSVFYT